ncbi:hypothetical protein Droror1_Dr00000584 [Drosera rotundifolia]
MGDRGLQTNLFVGLRNAHLNVGDCHTVPPTLVVLSLHPLYYKSLGTPLSCGGYSVPTVWCEKWVILIRRVRCFFLGVACWRFGVTMAMLLFLVNGFSVTMS